MVPLSGIVDVTPDGKTAQGRWYGSFHGALPRGGKLRALIDICFSLHMWF
jgi:hypothetical protein